MKQNIKIKETDLVISQMGLGTVDAGLKWDGPQADEMFGTFLELGGNLIDCARVYSDWVPGEIGRAERVLGDWLVRSKKRDQIVLMTKGGHPSMTVEKPDLHASRCMRAEMEKDVDLSLQALRSDFIDIYYYHRDDENMTVEELVDTMENFVKAGKIRYYACSNWSAHRMMEADAYAKRMGYRGFVADQALLNLGSRYMKPLDDDTLVYVGDDEADYHKDNLQNILMPYMGVCSGFFHQFDKKGEEAVKGSPYYTKENVAMAKRLGQMKEKYQASITQLVLGYFTQIGYPCVPLYGTTSVEHLKDAVGTFDIAFDKEDYQF